MNMSTNLTFNDGQPTKTGRYLVYSPDADSMYCVTYHKYWGWNGSDEYKDTFAMFRDKKVLWAECETLMEELKNACK